MTCFIEKLYPLLSKNAMVFVYYPKPSNRFFRAILHNLLFTQKPEHPFWSLLNFSSIFSASAVWKITFSYTSVCIYVCICAHSRLQRCTCTHVYISMCNVGWTTYRNYAQSGDWQVASHQLPNFRQNLQQAKLTVKELEWLQLPDSFFLKPYFRNPQKSQITEG